VLKRGHRRRRHARSDVDDLKRGARLGTTARSAGGAATRVCASIGTPIRPSGIPGRLSMRRGAA
jgi:hypothetical protein